MIRVIALTSLTLLITLTLIISFSAFYDYPDGSERKRLHFGILISAIAMLLIMVLLK